MSLVKKKLAKNACQTYFIFIYLLTYTSNIYCLLTKKYKTITKIIKKINTRNNLKIVLWKETKDIYYYYYYYY